MALVMPKRMMDLASHGGPEDFKVRVNNILQKTLEGMQVFGNRVLVATYVEPEKTAGGIIKAQRSIQEGLFQGNVGLVLKCGPTAFKYRGSFEWEGPKAEVGDWVVLRYSDAREFHLSGVSVRTIDDDLILCTIENPDAPY